MSERAQSADDAEATIVLPAPGRKRSAFAPAIERHAAAADLAALGGLNPLVDAANPILAAVPQIRHALRHPDPSGLRARLRQQVAAFERSALTAGIAQAEVHKARFALCALLDDSAAATPWGREWAALLAVFLGARSDPVARDLARLKLPPVALAAPSQRQATLPGVSALSIQLAQAIGADVEVGDAAEGELILLKGDHIFALGAARPDASVHAVIARIAAALDALPGAIVVSGHTDDQPIRTARFPSNWELSTERARSVASLMSAELRDPARLRAEGLADSEPVLPNDSAANRAKNRRVAILLRSGS